MDWKCDHNGQFIWAHGCNIYGNDISHIKTSESDCGPACVARADCSTFTWISLDDGICYLKSGGDAQHADGARCGKVSKRIPVKRNYEIKKTNWRKRNCIFYLNHKMRANAVLNQ